MLNESIVRRLVYVKLLYSISKERFENSTEIDIMQSILTLDNCFENLFWVILDLKDPITADSFRRKNRPTFQNLFNEVQKYTGKLDLSFVKEMHEARNLIQHSGIMISQTHATRYLTQAEEILPKISRETLGIDWEDISLAMLIEDEQVAEYYREGERLYKQRDFKNAALKIIEAFETAKVKRQAGQSGSLVFFDAMLARNAANRSKSPTASSIINYIDKVYSEVEVLKMGLDYKEWREYRLPLGSLNPYEDILKKLRNATPKDKPSLLTMTNDEIRTWLTRVTPFIIRSILYWQQGRGLWEWKGTLFG
jgi:hypothetical protein